MADMGNGGNTNFDSSDTQWTDRLSAKPSLRDHLAEQARISLKNQTELAIAEQLIDRLDSAGFLRKPAEDLAQAIGCDIAVLEKVLKTCKGFDPTGIFASDIAECFALQLAEKNRLDPAMQSLLSNLNLLADHNIKGLVELCGVSREDVLDMIAELKRLNPKPASDYEHFVVQTAIPDVLMQKRDKSDGGGWDVRLNSDTLPKVLVNQEYYTTVSQSAKSKEDKAYVNDKLASANWLIRAMDQRAQTILKVAATIVEKQYAFFLYGVEYLTTLTLREIAEEIDMHESTISRVTTNKYIGTPRGIYELKYFFSSGVSGAGGTDVSAEAVKAKIKTMISKEEKPKDVLSDDKIAELLKEEGIDIARRTVAKYREALNFGSSVQRRKILKNKAQ